MNIHHLIDQSMRGVGRYRLRSTLMMLGTAIGIAALVFVVSVGTSAEQKVLATVRRLFSESSMFVTSGGGLLNGGPRGEGSRLRLDDLEAISNTIPGVDTWDPLQVLEPLPARQGERSTTVRVLGQSERAERVWERSITRGEFFSAADVARSSRVAVIGTTVQRALFSTQDGTQDPIGAEILVNGVSLRVIGVLESMGTDVHGIDRDNEVVAPISTVMRRLTNTDTIRGAKVLVRDPRQIQDVAKKIANLLRERHSIAAGQSDDFTLVTPLDVQRMIGMVRKVFFVVLPLIAAIALLAGTLIAGSLMWLSVTERRSEIGLRRAVGAAARDVGLQFLIETTVIVVSGGVAGLVLGEVASYALAHAVSLRSFFSWKATAGALGVSTMTGIVAGLLPARRAAALAPAEALR